MIGAAASSRCNQMLRSCRRFARSPCVAPHERSTKRCISSSRLTITKVTNDDAFNSKPPKEEIAFGSIMSDHMLTINWSGDDAAWSAPAIHPFGPISMDPASPCLHYGSQCFEGMKAYKSTTDGSIRLFRPDKNMERLSQSMDRLRMPGADFDRDELIKCIGELVRLDERWIEEGEGYSLYLRPTVISTNRALGLANPYDLTLFVITSPVGPYFKSGFKPVKLKADSRFVRAWPGGTGSNKVGGNYAPTIRPTSMAAEEGFSQILWLFGDDHEITEVGSMNVFFSIMNENTQRPELVTPPLTRGDILPGVTRDSVLALGRTWDDIDVSERSLTMKEVRDAAEDGRLLEAFGTGTAAVISPISTIQYEGSDIEIPPVGPLSQRFWKQITGIQYGNIEGPEGWSVKVA